MPLLFVIVDILFPKKHSSTPIVVEHVDARYLNFTHNTLQYLFTYCYTTLLELPLAYLAIILLIYMYRILDAIYRDTGE